MALFGELGSVGTVFVRFFGGVGVFPLQTVHVGFGTHPVSCSMGIGPPLPAAAQREV